MSSEVKRYEIYGPDWDSEETPFGFWVMYSDYAALEAECEMLRRENAYIRAGWADYGQGVKDE